MNNNLKISIVVPVHNAATTIDRCIKSIVEQSYKNIECILIENGSCDNSKELCQKYCELYYCVKFAVSSELGVSAARNLGLSIATGDIIGFCDADDFLEPEAIQIVVSTFFDNPDIVGMMSAFYVGRNEKEDIKKQYMGLKKDMLTVEKAIMLTIGDDNLMGSVWNKYYLASIAKNTLFDTNLSYCEDTYYNVKLLSSLSDEKIAYVKKPLYCYIINSSSVTHQREKLYNENGELKYIISLKKIIQDCKLSKSCLSIAKMKIVILATNCLFVRSFNNLQKDNLKKEIKINFWHLIINITKFNFIGNVKILVKLLLIWNK